MPTPTQRHPRPSPLPSCSDGKKAGENVTQSHLALIEQDCARVGNPDIIQPFANLEDALERLLPYHVRASGGADGCCFSPQAPSPRALQRSCIPVFPSTLMDPCACVFDRWKCKCISRFHGPFTYKQFTYTTRPTCTHTHTTPTPTATPTHHAGLCRG